MSRKINEIAANLPLDEVLPTYIGYRKGYGNLDYAVSPFSGSDNYNHLRVNKLKNVWFDYAAGFGGNAIKFMMHYKNVSYKEAVKLLQQDFPEYFNGAKEVKTTYHEVKEMVATDDVKNKAYQLFINFFNLTKSDEQELKQVRHLSQKQITTEKFFTFPVANSQNIASFNQYLKDKKVPLESFHYVPGFSIKDEALVWMSADGIGLPIINPKNEIIGIQIRLRHGDVSRYIWFSSQGRSYGAGSGSVIANFDAGFGQHLVITEGIFKAIKLQEAFNTHVVALPGVSNTRNLDANVAWFLKAKQMLKQQPKDFIIVFDSDFQKNDNVKQAIERLTKQLAKFNLPIKLFYWKYDEAIKGFDDLVNKYPRTYPKMMKSAVLYNTK